MPDGLLLFLLIAFIATTSTAFQISGVYSQRKKISWDSSISTSTIACEIVNGRDIVAFESWSSRRGILKENGFVLSENDGSDWSVSVTESVVSGDRVLQVPSLLVLSSSKIRQETTMMDNTSIALEYLKNKKLESQTNQFLLWLKILQEYEKEDESILYPWLRSLPKKFSNAIYMDDVEVECLAPFAWSLATIEILHMDVFVEALNMTSDIISQQTTDNYELLRWAFCVVFTRCWGQDGDDEDRKDIVPMGDMFNHGQPGNVFVDYDGNGNCNIILKDDILPGNPMTLSYGFETNPYRFLVVFGFVDFSQKTIYSQLLSANPSKRHVEMGYDVSKMTFNATDGSFTEEVWDFLLFSLLEQVPELQEIYYNAHISGDTNRKDSLRKKFYLETCIMLKKHVDRTLLEMEKLIFKIDQQDLSKHEVLPLIRKNNLFVAQTFSKVKCGVDRMIQDELSARKAQEQQTS